MKKNYSVSIKTLLNVSLQTKTVQFGRFECVVNKTVISQWKSKNSDKQSKTLHFSTLADLNVPLTKKWFHNGSLKTATNNHKHSFPLQIKPFSLADLNVSLTKKWFYNGGRNELKT